MATALSTKFVLKNTTKMTLNERFSQYRAQAQTANLFRQKIQMQRQASSANLRLAQQMANRPTVIAALRLKKRSLQNRLGQKQPSTAGNIKSRLSLANARYNSRPIEGRLGSVRGKGRGRGMVRRGGFKAGTSPLLKGRIGLPKFTKPRSSNQRAGFNRKRGGFRGSSRGFRPPNQKSNARGRGGGRGRGRGWWNSGKTVSKAELDNELDQYMAETKSSLGQFMSG